MRVSGPLLNAANHDHPAVIAMVNKWSHASFVQKASSPGFYVPGGSQRLMERIVQLDQRNPAGAADPDTILHIDFIACNRAIKAAQLRHKQSTCPTLFPT